MGDPNKQVNSKLSNLNLSQENKLTNEDRFVQNTFYPNIPTTPVTENVNTHYQYQHPQTQASNFTEIPLDPASFDWRKTAHSIKAKLSYILTHEALQDVTLIVGVEKERIRAHKFMLLLTSSSFENMMFTDENHLCISIPDVNPSAFKSVLKFIYTDKFEVTIENAMHSLYIAKKFDIPSLAERCIESLKSNISENNVVTIFQRAKDMNEHELSNNAFGYLLRNARKVINSTDFYALSYENLCSFLERDDLNVEELSLFQATIRWAEEKCKRDDLDGSPEDLRYELKRAISLIRFPLLTSEEFTMHVASSQILGVSEMLELYKYFSVSPANRVSLTPLAFGNKKRCEASGTLKSPTYTLFRHQGVGTGPWNHIGTLMQIRFMVDRPISIRGFGFYGSFDVENQKYVVDIYLESTRNLNNPVKVKASDVVQLIGRGRLFQVNFNEMVPIHPNIWYLAGFSLKGPSTCWGTHPHPEVSLTCGDRGTVTFRFEEVPADPPGFGVQNLASYQLPQILFTI